MSHPVRQLGEARTARDAARAAFDARLAQVRGDLEARGIGGRVAHKLGDDARDGLDRALEVAGESKTVIAGTLAALALWFLRNPIIDWIEQQFGDDAPENDKDDRDE